MELLQRELTEDDGVARPASADLVERWADAVEETLESSTAPPSCPFAGTAQTALSGRSHDTAEGGEARA